MPKSNAYLLVSAAVFALVSGAHLTRAVAQWPVQISTWQVPLELSWMAAIGAATLSLWALAQLRRRT